MCDSSSKCGSKYGGCAPSIVAKIILVVGGINWGFVGLGMLMGESADAWNVIHVSFGQMPELEALIYLLVGAAAVMEIFGCKCKKCIVACGCSC